LLGHDDSWPPVLIWYPLLSLWSPKGTSSRTFLLTLHVQGVTYCFDILVMVGKKKEMRLWLRCWSSDNYSVDSTAVQSAHSLVSCAQQNMDSGGLWGLSTNREMWSETEISVFLLGHSYVYMFFALFLLLALCLCLYYCSYMFEELFYTLLTTRRREGWQIRLRKKNRKNTTIIIIR
jgi:hypothetical protein